MAWDTSTLDSDGTIRVVTDAQPVIAAFTIIDANLVMTGSGGAAGGTYYVIRSFDLAVPIAIWPRIQTNSFDGTGDFNAVIEMDPVLTNQFLSIELP